MNWVISLALIILLSCAISSCKLDLSQAAIGNCLGRLPPVPLATSLRLVCHKRVKGGGNSLARRERSWWKKHKLTRCNWPCSSSSSSSSSQLQSDTFQRQFCSSKCGILCRNSVSVCVCISISDCGNCCCRGRRISDATCCPIVASSGREAHTV